MLHDAVQILEGIAQIADANVEPSNLYLALGVAQRKAGDHDRARGAFMLALDRGAEAANISLQLGLTEAAARKRYQRALRRLNDALAEIP